MAAVAENLILLCCGVHCGVRWWGVVQCIAVEVLVLCG